MSDGGKNDIAEAGVMVQTIIERITDSYPPGTHYPVCEILEDLREVIRLLDIAYEK